MRLNRIHRMFGDVRELTRAHRLLIGFKERNAWKDAPATFTKNTLTIEGHPVMEDWEDGYMRELARIATMEGGRVLEVGFGMGISGRYVQQSDIDEHIVIEANRDVYDHLCEFARGARVPVTPLFGFWEDVTRTLPAGSISGILFDTYPLSESEIHQNHFPFFKEAYRLLHPGGILTYYSDEIRDFSHEHTALLGAAGFMNIDKRIVGVEPPADCTYWKSNTILAPIIRK